MSGVQTSEEHAAGVCQSPPYAVILHNDDVNEMEYVVAALQKAVVSLSTAEARRIMLIAHEAGRSVVIVCPLERAEFYRDRIRSFRLSATVERA
jgi:ATP-dependent Clp protease adaptor protein ClpS